MNKILLLCLVVLTASFSSTALQGQTLKLPSGRLVKVLGVGRIEFSQGAPALMMKYETDLKMNDLKAVRKEADEIWSSVFQAEVEKAGLQGGILSATEKATGFLFQKANGYNFVYEKRADGKWHCLDDDKSK